MFLRSPRSEKFKARTKRFFSNPASILILPACIIAITQGILRPHFSEETHTLYNDWTYFTLYFCFFLFGMICYSAPVLWDIIGSSRKYLLAGTVIVLIPFYALYLHLLKFYPLPLSEFTADVKFEVISVFVSWFTVITVIGFGQHHFNKNHSWLSKINEGVYPFYVLHQTVIIWLGYYICQTDWSIGAKYWSVSLLTLLTCLAIYLLFIRPFNMLRLLFGMKPHPRS